MLDHDLPLEHRKRKLSSGTTLHIWKAKAYVSEYCIVLQHGFTEYAERFLHSHRRLITTLCAKRYTVYALDLWGHGDSPGDGSAVTHIGKAVRDHIEVRRSAVAENLPVFLIGFSLGGLVTAASLVRASQPDVQGVVLMYPVLPEPVPWPLRAFVRLGSTLIPGTSIPVKSASYDSGTRDPEQVKISLADPRIHRRQIPFLLAATAIEEGDVVWASLKTWEVSTLVMHGTADVSTSHQMSERFVEGIASKDKQMRSWTDGRHELLLDLEGSQVAAELMAWISQRTMTP